MKQVGEEESDDRQQSGLLLTIYYVEDEGQDGAAGRGVGDVHRVVPHVELRGTLIQQGPVLQQVTQSDDPA